MSLWSYESVQLVKFYFSKVSLPTRQAFRSVRQLEQGKKSPEWWWLKDKEEKSPQKQNKGRSEDRVRTSGKTNNTLGCPNLHRTGPGQKTYKKRSQSQISLSLFPPSALGCSSLCIFGLMCPHARRWIFLLSSK